MFSISFFQLIRIHHWIKNILLFIPLLLTYNFVTIEILLKYFLIFISFSFLCSSNYILNDLIDYKSDRLHPKKSNKPIASKKISANTSIILLIIFLFLSFFVNFIFNLQIAYFLFFYFFLAQLYTFYLKQKLIVDILVLSLFYSFRIFLGMYFTQQGFSFWLLCFSFLFFLGLSFIKRIVDIDTLPDKNQIYKQYLYSDRLMLIIFGVCSSFLSMTIFLLYINSEKFQTNFSSINFFLVISFFIFMWTCQLWFDLYRKKITIDPIIYVLKNSNSYFYAILILLGIFFSK